jgi:hypothetical protein
MLFIFFLTNRSERVLIALIILIKLNRAEGRNMARIKINDLPENQKVSKEEMKAVYGGVMLKTTSSDSTLNPQNLSMFSKYETENCVAGVRG